MKRFQRVPAPSSSLAVVAAVNDEAELARSLGASSLTATQGARLLIERGHRCASGAYNAGLARAAADVVVFAHQDVYLPRGWDLRLRLAIEYLSRVDPKWAVLGVIGSDTAGNCRGRVWSNGLNRLVGSVLEAPTAVVSIDEVVIVLRTDCGLQFDEELPGYHLYGTDICQQALRAGRGVYAFDGPVVHNSLPIRRLDGWYWAAYRYTQRKWRSRLPIPTTVVPVTRSGWPLLRHWLWTTRNLALGRAPSRTRHQSPESVARALGFEGCGEGSTDVAQKEAMEAAGRMPGAALAVE